MLLELFLGGDPAPKGSHITLLDLLTVAALEAGKRATFEPEPQLQT